MNHTNKIINWYHQYFESYAGIITIKSFWTWLSFASTSLFFLSIYWYIRKKSAPFIEIEQSERLLVILAFEVITMLCWFRLQFLRDQAVIKRCQAALSTKEENIEKLKEIWLESTLAAPKTSYLKIAEEIDKIITLQEKHRSSLAISKKHLAGLIFSNDSKNRTLAMLMGICAGTIAFSIAGGARIDDIFIFFEGVTPLELLATTVTISALIIFSFTLLRYLLLVFLLFIEVFFENTDNTDNTNPRRASIFIKQLLKFHQFEKAHIRIPKTETRNRDQKP